MICGPCGLDSHGPDNCLVAIELKIGEFQPEHLGKLQFYLEAWEDGRSADRAPREGALELRVPGPDFEQIMWQA